MAFWIIVTLLATRNLKVRDPGKVQVVLESGVEFLNGFVKQTIGPHWRPFAPYLGTVALYIGLANIVSIFGLVPPTKDVSVTAALAVMSLVLIYGAQFRYNGLKGGMKCFADPMPVLLPINLMEIAIRPAGAVYATVRQRAGRFHHHGDHQARWYPFWCLPSSVSTLTCSTA